MASDLHSKTLIQNSSKLNKPFTGIAAFVIVLLTMPLGHTAMILMEKILGHEFVFIAAFCLGLAGIALLFWGSFIKNNTCATFAGLFGGLFIWTGWIEFAHVFIAQKYSIQPLMVNGEIVTKPEYLIMPASAGFLGYFLFEYLFKTNTGCGFYNYFQRIFKINRVAEKKEFQSKNIALITSSELIMILWTFYLLLLLAYDESVFGDKHFFTYFVAFGSLTWSVYLFIRLFKISNLGYAIRYSIPAVIIFWNFIEILGRWNLFSEIWIHPEKYYIEISLIFIIFIFITLYSFKAKVRNHD